MDRELARAFEDVREGLLESIREAVRIPSFSDEEGELAAYLVDKMRCLGFDEVSMDSTGNVIGRMGSGGPLVQFDSHMDTVRVNDADKWAHPPFSGDVAEGYLWGRGSVDMKSALLCSLYGAFLAKRLGYLEDKTVLVTGTVCEEYCDGVNLKLLYDELKLKPDYCIICEPSDNTIAAAICDLRITRTSCLNCACNLIGFMDKQQRFQSAKYAIAREAPARTAGQACRVFGAGVCRGLSLHCARE